MNGPFPPRERKLIDYYYDYAALLAALGALFSGLVPWLFLPQGPGPNKYLWGLHRHEWINLHLAFALTFTAIAAIHLVRHWRWVRAMTPRHINFHKGFQGLAGFLATTAIVSLVIGGAVYWLNAGRVVESRGKKGWRGDRVEIMAPATSGEKEYPLAEPRRADGFDLRHHKGRNRCGAGGNLDCF